MRFATLDEWLRWQQQLHTTSIDLGLERIRAVARRLGLLAPDCTVLTVAGTNGKGSCVALLEAMLAPQARVGAYTSPHFARYSERVRIDRREADDDLLCAAFDEIERARGAISLSFFEYGTLAAMWAFRERAVEVAVLEVGLGGRMDAVNVWDADAAVITSIGIDHTEWLGHTRLAIGREKAGILRPDRPAVCGDPRPPESLLDHAARLGARLRRLGVDFHAEPLDGATWRYRARGGPDWTLPQPPGLPGAVQLHNAASALTALAAVGRCEEAPARTALATVRLTGRFQTLDDPVDTVLDIAHNPDSALNLARNLRRYRPGRPLHAVFSALRDKDVARVLTPLCAFFDSWQLFEVDSERAMPLDTLTALAEACGLSGANAHDSLEEAAAAARRRAGSDGTVVVFGSAFAVGAYLKLAARPEAEISR